MKKFASMVSMSLLALSVSATAFAASEGVVDRSVNFRSAPSTSSKVYSTLKPGTTFQVLDEYNRYWTKVSVDGQVGYLSDSYITITSSPSANTGTVVRSVNFRSQPSTDGRIYRLLKSGTTFTLLERVNAYWLKISVDGQVGYVSTNYVATGGTSQPSPSEPASAIADRVIAHAQSLQGVTSYKFGVNKPPTVLDCSSFTKYVFGLEGVSLKWGTRFQKSAGSAVSKSNLKKGDLVFFGTEKKGTINHVGIYIGSGRFIHNSPTFDGVGTSTLTSGYWADRYISARRVL